jgi:hypothetical protein
LHLVILDLHRVHRHGQVGGVSMDADGVADIQGVGQLDHAHADSAEEMTDGPDLLPAFDLLGHPLPLPTPDSPARFDPGRQSPARRRRANPRMPASRRETPSPPGGALLAAEGR